MEGGSCGWDVAEECSTGRPWRGDGQSFVGVCVWSGGWRKLLEDFDCFIYLKNCSLALRGGTSGAFDSERGLLSPFLLPLIPAPPPRGSWPLSPLPLILARLCECVHAWAQFGAPVLRKLGCSGRVLGRAL